MKFEELSANLREFGISTNFSNFESLKESGTKIPIRYEPSIIEYYRKYFPGGGDSIICGRQFREAQGYWPLAIGGSTSNRILSTNGRSIFPPLFNNDLSLKVKTSLTQRCFEILIELNKASKEYRVGDLEIHQDHTGAIPIWMECVLEQNLDFEIFLDSILALDSPYSKINSNFSDKTRYDIRKSQERFRFSIIPSHEVGESFQAYRSLHHQVAGRITRDAITWEMQKARLERDEAILILAHEAERGNLISGSYFEFNSVEAMYSSSATDRAFFKTPVNHGMQALAIQNFISRGISFYLLGEQLAPSHNDSKIENIAKFKSRFASHSEARFKVVLPPQGATSKEINQA